MTTPSKSKYPLNQVLFKINTKRLHTNHQLKCIDCLKTRSNKNEHECKKMWFQWILCTKLLKCFICNIVDVVMYKNGNIVKN